jgi:cardiolipin synthase
MWLAHALTLSRIPLAVAFWATYGNRVWSLALVGLAALTDALDGMVARRAGATSTVGEWLDPLADKVFVLGVLGAIQVHDPVPWWLLGLIVARELVLIPLIGAYRVVVHGRAEHAYKAQPIGKAATIAEIAAVISLILRSPAATAFAIAAGALGLAAVASYIGRAAHAPAER